MIFTSYFAKLNKLPKNVFPVAICAKVPEWYKGARYDDLAPDYNMLMQWKRDHNDDNYAKRFNKMVLDDLDVFGAIHGLGSLLPTEMRYQMHKPVWRNPDWHIALVCYEKPDDFCHRHLVADWLRRNGFECEEWSEE